MAEESEPKRRKVLLAQVLLCSACLCSWALFWDPLFSSVAHHSLSGSYSYPGLNFTSPVSEKNSLSFPSLSPKGKAKQIHIKNDRYLLGHRQIHLFPGHFILTFDSSHKTWAALPQGWFIADGGRDIHDRHNSNLLSDAVKTTGQGMQPEKHIIVSVHCLLTFLANTAGEKGPLLWFPLSSLLSPLPLDRSESKNVIINHSVEYLLCVGLITGPKDNSVINSMQSIQQVEDCGFSERVGWLWYPDMIKHQSGYFCGRDEHLCW